MKKFEDYGLLMAFPVMLPGKLSKTMIVEGGPHYEFSLYNFVPNL
jgi:hypothetical protein